MSKIDELAGRFEAERPRLLALAYRTTGSVADAEDAVQEAWLRLDRTTEQIHDLPAWLTRVVARLCLDRLGSAARRRETYVGQWLPEPVVRPYETAGTDPLDVVVRHDDARFGALVVLDRLTPQQRVAFVLHDVFDLPFDEIGEVLGISAEAARQHASRGRRAAAAAPEPVPDAEHEDAVGRFVEALLSGDLETVVATLHPDAVAIGDAGGTTGTALNAITGPEKVARFYLGLLVRFGEEAMDVYVPVRVNGQLGLWLPGLEGPDARSSSPSRVAGFTVRDGLVVATYDLANPAKLTGVRLEDA
ncbi:RNA polymerase sigma factor SigJ [Aeromicrobium sp. CTD01-1L150]|uniref:RNA polymerase sigma factor SigJ n=1 Tax=Aeromicrobium sp. CTD01-1L150 TaxID=3341830 RepID=UPI0035C0D62A